MKDRNQLADDETIDAMEQTFPDPIVGLVDICLMRSGTNVVLWRASVPGGPRDHTRAVEFKRLGRRNVEAANG